MCLNYLETGGRPFTIVSAYLFAALLNYQRSLLKNMHAVVDLSYPCVSACAPFRHHAASILRMPHEPNEPITHCINAASDVLSGSWRPAEE